MSTSNPVLIKANFNRSKDLKTSEEKAKDDKAQQTSGKSPTEEKNIENKNNNIDSITKSKDVSHSEKQACDAPPKGKENVANSVFHKIKPIYVDTDLENGIIQIDENGVVVSKLKSKVTEDKFSDSDFEEDSSVPSHICATGAGRFTSWLHQVLCNKYKQVAKIVIWITILLLYLAYFIAAIIYDFKKAIPLIVLTVLFAVVFMVWLVVHRFGDDIEKRCLNPSSATWQKYGKFLRWGLYICLLVAFVVFTAVDVRKDPYRLTSLSGIAILVLISFVFSKHPSKIKWQPVIWGLALQMAFGLIVLRWSVGLSAVNWFSEQVVIFLAYTDAGSKFVFGDDFIMHPFAMQSLPVVIFFSAVIGILYYWGIMQKVVKSMAVVMQVTMGTTALETLATASNIFVSYVEVAPILVPYIHRLTKSELHAILTSGFATVAGSILAIYISFGAPAVHLISACIISAPAALAIAKLSFPETKISKTKTQKDVHLPKSTQKNFVEAAAAGAMIAIKLIGGIIACLIAFLAIVAFIDAALAWLGSRVGVGDPPLSFSLICSYLFWPLTVMMGVEPADAKRVASMLGLKIFVDDVLCYADLGTAVANGDISDRSAVIATYACCGFGSLGALGVALGTMFAIAPKRKKAISDIIIRALINGNIAAFMTACVAGFLYAGPNTGNSSSLNSTNIADSTTQALV